MGMMKPQFRSIVIFGGAGFIGSNWTERLLTTTEAKVHVFDNLSRQGARHNLEYLQKVAGRTGRLQITVGDVRDAVMVSRVVRYATEIYNFAAQVAVTTSLADPRLDFEVNLGGTFNILEAARQHGQNPFLLFTSTNKVYGNSGDGAVRVDGKRYVAAGTQWHGRIGSRWTSTRPTAAPRGQPTSMCAIMPASMACARWSSGCRASRGRASSAARTRDGLRTSCIRRWKAGRSPSTATGARCATSSVFRICCAPSRPPTRSASTPQGRSTTLAAARRTAISLLELMDHVEAITGARAGYNLGEQRAGDQLVYVTDHGKFSRHHRMAARGRVVDETLGAFTSWYRGQSRVARALACRAPGRRSCWLPCGGPLSGALRAGQSQLGLHRLHLFRLPRSAHSAGAAVCRAEDSTPEAIARW